MKASKGWLSQTAPPQGFNIDPNSGLALPFNALVNAVRSATINSTSSHTINGFQPPTPLYPTLPPPPPIVQLPPPPNAAINLTDTSSAGTNFGRSGSRSTARPNSSDASSVGMVSINGQQYTGQVFDRNGNPLN